MRSLEPKIEDIIDLGCAVFDLLTPVVRTTKAGPSLAVGSKGEEVSTDLLQEIVQNVLRYTQITSAKVRNVAIINVANQSRKKNGRTI